MKAVVKQIEISKTRRTLALSDIHGNLPFLRGLLDKAGFGPEDDLFILGDILEKSEGSLETLRFIMELSEKYTVHTLLGNCDNITLAFIDGRDEIPEAFFEYWFRTRKEKCTLVNMAGLLGLELTSPNHYPAARKAIAERFRPELDFLRGLPHIFLSGDYLFVHGGVPRENDLEELDAYGVMKNDNFLTQGHSFRRWVIAGHTPVTLYREDIPSATPIIDRCRHIVSIDGGCNLKLDGQLNALILPREPGESFPGWPMTASRSTLPWTTRNRRPTPSTSAGATASWRCWSGGRSFPGAAMWRAAGSWTSSPNTSGRKTGRPTARIPPTTACRWRRGMPSASCVKPAGDACAKRTGSPGGTSGG